MTPAPAQTLPAACTCGAGDVPIELHDDECAVQEGSYDTPPASAELVEAPAAVPGLDPDLSIVPARQEMEGLAAMAATLAQSNLVPKALQGKPADVFLVLLTARDIGISLTTALRECHVIDGKVALSPKVKMAKIRTQKMGRIFPHQPPRQVWKDGELVQQLCPCGADDGPNDGERATWHAERADEPGILYSSTFTMDEARRVPAREHGKNITLAEKSTYQAWPARMLSWRALGHLEDDVFPEVGTGLYDIDQVGGMMDGDGQPIDVSLAAPLPGTGRPALQAPEIPLADREVRLDIHRRIGQIQEHAEANAEMEPWWVERELPAPRNLTEPQSRVVLARLAHVEAKYGLTPPEKPEPAQEGGGAPAPSDAPAEPQAAEEPAEGAVPPPVAEKDDGIPTSPPDGDVAGWLVQRAAAMNSASIQNSFQVRGVPAPTGSIRDQRRAWAIDQMEQLARGVTWLLCMGAAEVAELHFIRE